MTGGKGFLGSHVIAGLLNRGVEADFLEAPTSAEADLRDPATCSRVVKGVDLIIHLAALAGGIGLNDERPGDLFYDNALMGLQLMEAAQRAGVLKFVSIGTTCSYPRVTPVPFREEHLFEGDPDPVTGPYGWAKRLQLVQGKAYRKQYGFNAIHLIPTNLYGPGDHFDEVHGHVIPSLVRRFQLAADDGLDCVTVWGTGQATREFLYVKDCVEGILLAAEHYDDADPVNLGSGIETPIRELVEKIAAATGYQGSIEWDSSRPDGQPRRSLDVSRARERFGFQAKTSLEEGLRHTVAWFRAHRGSSLRSERN